MINKKDEVTMCWRGQDGCIWRVLKCWVGNGYTTFTQRQISHGVWV